MFRCTTLPDDRVCKCTLSYLDKYRKRVQFSEKGQSAKVERSLDAPWCISCKQMFAKSSRSSAFVLPSRFFFFFYISFPMSVIVKDVDLRPCMQRKLRPYHRVPPCMGYAIENILSIHAMTRGVETVLHVPRCVFHYS